MSGWVKVTGPVKMLFPWAYRGDGHALEDAGIMQLLRWPSPPTMMRNRPFLDLGRGLT